MLGTRLVVTQVLVGSFGLADYVSRTSAVGIIKFWHNMNGRSSSKANAPAAVGCDFMAPSLQKVQTRRCQHRPQI